ncbi:MAG: SDR family NAD(P)-dependent oxidoreductase [Solirubrobacteraceae bacterium]
MNSSESLTGKAALVTGGSRGIGAAIVRRLAQGGADVAFTYNTGADEAAAVARDVRDIGRTVIAIAADLGIADRAPEVIQATVKSLGQLDILVNNAGVSTWGPLARVTVEDFDRVLAVDARAPFLLMQACAEALSDGGRIVNISSAVTSTALAGGRVRRPSSTSSLGSQRSSFHPSPSIDLLPMWSLRRFRADPNTKAGLELIAVCRLLHVEGG